MKRALLVIALIALIVVGLGLYMGWFEFSASNQDNKSSVSLSVDRNKLEADKDKAVDAVEELGQNTKDIVTGTTPNTDDKPGASQ